MAIAGQRPTDMDYRVIDLTEQQLPQLCSMEQECFSIPWTEAQLRSQLKDSTHEFLGAVDGDGRMLGYVGMSYVLDEGYISNVAVGESFRRCGVGSSLLGELLVRAKSMGLAFVTLEVRENNLPALGLYGALGFVPVGRRRGYYEAPKEDAILMTYFLNRGKDIENTGI